MELEDEFGQLAVRNMEVKYFDEYCVLCGSRIDEFGFCACGSGGD